MAERACLIEALPPPVGETVSDGAPWSPLPASLDEYLEQRPSKLRRLVAQAGRRLEGAGVDYRVVDEKDAQPALERLRRLREAQWGNRSSFLPQFDRFARAAHEGICAARAHHARALGTGRGRDDERELRDLGPGERVPRCPRRRPPQARSRHVAHGDCSTSTGIRKGGLGAGAAFAG
ncbi:MAG: hypothetical protein M3046_04835 [Actinomycetota bacterium]|nr:hypothetical protein [Actinomycetota bacterium]